MPQGHVEIERKFEVPDSFALPDLASVPGVETVEGPEQRDLEAVYHDTADLRLLRAPVTLRRRTGGPDAGWHVKLPAGEDARRELHFPLGRAARTPPRAVLAPVRGLVGTAEVAPVATLRTSRRVTLLRDGTGRVLAEVADDSVTGTSLPSSPGEPAEVVSWRELEVELVDGDDELLAAVTERLLAAGAVRSASASKLGRVLEHRLTAPDGRPSPDGRRGRKAGRKKRTAGAVVLTALADQVHALQRADLQVRAGEPEGVHDLRVACRRLRAVLAAFRPVLDQERTDPLRDELRWLGGQLSPARDGEVALEHLRRLVADLPTELVLGPVAARLQQAAIAGGETARRAAERTLRGDRYLALLDGLFDVLERPPLTAAAGEPADDLLTAAIRRAGKRLARRTAAAGAEPSAMHLHAVRKAVKRTRYTAEVVGGRRARALVDVAEEAQDLLGAAQDTSATREQCRRLGVAAFAAGENAWTYGLLHGLEQARADRSVAAFWALAPALGEAVARASGRKG